MEPLHFKPICLAIDGAKSGIAVKVILPSYNASVHLQYYDESLEASFVDLLYSPLGTRSFQTQTTCSSDATPQYSIDESQKQGRQRGIWNGKKTDNTTKICASDEAVVGTMNLWYMGKSCGSSATKKY
ncbi:hypothetical protein Tco_0407573 [Tanacetum coccineum]